MTLFRPADRASARERLGWPNDGLVALFPGCPDFPNKGYDIACNAVSHAARILGRTVELKVLWNVAPDDVPLYMAASNAMILASQQEGSPNVVKEALACELPIVATAVGDVPELLSDAIGCHVCARTPSALGDALAAALPFGRLTCGRAILLHRALDEGSIAKRLIALYHAVSAEHGVR
jgi:glycosyltransferase involved in cell wall biosynthesis